MEARKRELELRSLGLERVVKELMSAMDLMKTHLTPQQIKHEEWRELGDSSKELKGLAIYIEDSSIGINLRKADNLRETFGEFVISSRRKFIPYQLRTTVFMLSRLRNYNLIDQIIGAIIMMGSMLWTSFS